MFDEFAWTHVSENRNALTGAYEPLQIDLLRSLAARCSNAIFLDIGANIGVYSIMLSNETVFSELHAFEALASLTAEIEKNLDLNNLRDRITLHQVVLSDEAGEVDFLVRSDFAGDGGVRETHHFSHLPYDRIDRMHKVALDDIFHHRDRDLVLKVDVEGHELKVLRGAQETLQYNRGFLQIEILRHASLDDTEAFLNSVGWYRLFSVDSDIYFSNMDDIDSADKRLELLEDGLKQFVCRSRRGAGRPTRKRIMPGIVVELRKSYVRHVKRFLGRDL